MSDTIPQLGDPFSAAASDQTQPGMLGQSPAFWQHLAMFGGNLAAAANARTADGHLAYGSGFAGPFGAAIGETAQQSQRQALSNAEIGQTRARTQGIGLQNRLQAIQMPAEMMRAQMQLGAMQDPNTMAALGYGAPAFSQAPQPQSGPAFEAGVHQNESGGSMAPGIKGDGGQAAGPMQIHPGALQDVNSKFGTNLTPQQVSQYPDLGKWAGDRYLEMQQQKFGPVGGVAAYNAGPGRMQQAINGQAPLPASTVQYVQRATGGQGGPGDSYLQQADALTARANRIAQAQSVAKLYGVPPGPGLAADTAAMHTQASQLREAGVKLNSAGPLADATNQSDLRFKPQIAGQEAAQKANVELNTAGPIQAQKSLNSNIDVREGGMAGLVNADGTRTFLKNPKLIETQDALGNTVPMHAAPPLPGSPPGTLGEATPIVGPGGQPVITKLPPNVQDARNKAYSEFAGKDTDTFQAATNVQGVLGQMNEAARVLNQQKGMLGSGPYAPERLAFASKVNDVLRTAGLPPAFDPNALGSWEELTKATKTAGFELSSHYEGHARQAAQTIENATSAVPGDHNSPVGFAKVFAGINEQAQLGMDLHNTKLPVYQSGGDIVGAETDFINKFPAQMYSRRAISTVTPYPISSDKELGRYLPGTFVTYKGNIVQVPQRPGAPPIPDYIHEMHLPQPGQPQGPQQMAPAGP